MVTRKKKETPMKYAIFACYSDSPDEFYESHETLAEAEESLSGYTTEDDRVFYVFEMKPISKLMPVSVKRLGKE